MISALTVHTSGVNFEGALATASAVVILLTPIAILLGRAFRRSLRETIREEVASIVATEVTPRFAAMESAVAHLEGVTNNHAVAIARLEGVQEGKRQAAAQATLTTVSPSHGT